MQSGGFWWRGWSTARRYRTVAGSLAPCAWFPPNFCAWFPTNFGCLCGVLVNNCSTQTWPFPWPVEQMYYYVVRHHDRDISCFSLDLLFFSGSLFLHFCVPKDFGLNPHGTIGPPRVFGSPFQAFTVIPIQAHTCPDLAVGRHDNSRACPPTLSLTQHHTTPSLTLNPKP